MINRIASVNYMNCWINDRNVGVRVNVHNNCLPK